MVTKFFKEKNKVLACCGLLYLFLLLLPGVSGSTKIVDRIAAVVNDDIILLSELNRSFAPYMEKIKASGYSPEKEKEMIFKARENILKQLIERKLIDQEIKNSHISVSEKEIDNAIERIKKDNFFTAEDLIKALENDGKTIEELRGNIREQILRKKLINFEVQSKIVITRDDIKTFYDSHKESYSGVKKVYLKNILMQIPAGAGEKEKLAVYAQMEAVYKRIEKGERFEDLAMAFSQAPQASNGGDLGFFRIDALAPKLQKAIDGLSAGEMTKILDTDQGYQIFFVQEIARVGAKSMEEASPEIEQKLFNEIVDNKFKTWLENLRKRSHIKIIR
ncbi:MAG: hypothetical protein B6I22_08875 [Desulfobacteraceae bacterium 4572_123]|nr:MAG: hypothetical protein B6I22_08875 [Desulfobacteraceae bacterium 4572_123]